MSKTKVEILNETQIRIEREFDAPLALVWKVTSEAEYIPEWWGPRGSKTEVDVMDFRVGGTYRFLNDGIGFRGEYKEIVPMKKVVNTFEFEP